MFVDDLEGNVEGACWDHNVSSRLRGSRSPLQGWRTVEGGGGSIRGLALKQLGSEIQREPLGGAPWWGPVCCVGAPSQGRSVRVQ